VQAIAIYKVVIADRRSMHGVVACGTPRGSTEYVQAFVQEKAQLSNTPVESVVHRYTGEYIPNQRVQLTDRPIIECCKCIHLATEHYHKAPIRILRFLVAKRGLCK
jgi:hypothetical protein